MPIKFTSPLDNNQMEENEIDENQIDENAKKENVTLNTDELRRRDMSVADLLVFATENNCSDLYIKLYSPSYVSKFNNLIQLPCIPLTKERWHEFYSLISNELNAEYAVNRTLDTSIDIDVPETSVNYGKVDYYHYRANFGYSEDKNTVIFRMIKPNLISFDNINFNPQCTNALYNAYSQKTGICIETGPTGSGKSTTMAACINTFTRPNGPLDNKVIITLEDPIENKFESTPTVLINQKELGSDFKSFGLGIKSALREHPNVIIVGEMRDKEVICTTIEAARTGHLVSTTFHASDVGGTISRILFHLDNDKNLAFDLISQLNIVISQRMLKRDDRYLVDTQYLLFNKAIKSHLIQIIENPNLNVAVEINNLISQPQLLQAGLSKDWEYPNEI